jgi:hypothetical protein
MYSFFNNCVGWNPDDVHTKGGLVDLIEDIEDITRRTFLRHVNREELSALESKLGYDAHPKQGLTMAGDWHVNYFRSLHHGQRVYGFQYSAVEYVFKEEAP